MTHRQLALRIAALAIIVQALTTRKADAYIDPGSGSFFVQMLLAGLLGAGMAIKAYWGRIKLFFTGGRQKPPAEDESADS